MFTHASWAADRALSYERHEFLGDSVLELAIAHELFDRYPDFSEGRLAKIRSHVVSRASCAVVARDLGLGLRGLVVIAHGNSSRRAVANAIRLGARGVEHDVVARLASRLPDRAQAV